jgi:hypothetical protein
MSQHTAGEWTVAFYAMQDGSGGTNVCAVKAGNRTLARTACQVVTDEDEANIRLMAAAPRLLQSCKRIAARVDALRQSHPEWTQYIDMIVHEEDGLAVAIAKSEGRQA